MTADQHDTLLVLPLLESIPEAARPGEATGPWLSEHVSGLRAFFVSFVIRTSAPAEPDPTPWELSVPRITVVE